LFECPENEPKASVDARFGCWQRLFFCIFSVLQSHYSSDCMDKRNRYMVDHADFIIAVWDGRPSGTGKTVTYARGRNGKSIIVIDCPVTLAIERL